MLTANEFVQMFPEDENKQIKIRYAKVDPNYTSGRPSLIFDNEETPTIKKYMFLSSYIPKPNDRVAVLDDFILGKVGEVYEGDSSKSPLDHNHDDRYYTESEVNTLLNGKSNTNHVHKTLSGEPYYTIGYATPPTAIPQPTFRYDFVDDAGSHGTYRTLITISGYSRGAIQISLPYGQYGTNNVIYWRYHNWSNDTWGSWMTL